MVIRKSCSFSLYDRHIACLRKLSGQAQVSDSEIIRELLEVASSCTAIYDGIFLRFEKPRFRWEAEGRFL